MSYMAPCGPLLHCIYSRPAHVNIHTHTYRQTFPLCSVLSPACLSSMHVLDYPRGSGLSLVNEFKKDVYCSSRGTLQCECCSSEQSWSRRVQCDHSLHQGTRYVKPKMCVDLGESDNKTCMYVLSHFKLIMPFMPFSTECSS
jgi:hypothetical protein